MSSDDDLEQVIVAIDIRESGTVGCSYYSAQEESLYLLGDIRSSSNDAIVSCWSWSSHSALRRALTTG
jgi:DNA mismatch repair protein MSH5